MKYLGNGDYLDADNVLVLEIDGKPDPFDPPGTVPPKRKFWTGFQFLSVPTWNWPLNIKWDNNPLQFATPATAHKVAKMVREAFGVEWDANVWTYELFEEQVSVGPFMWREKWMLRFKQGGRVAVLNAGLIASTCYRYRDNFDDAMRQQIMKELKKPVEGSDDPQA